MLAPTHACTTTNASVNYSRCVPLRPSKIPIAPMGDSRFARCLQGGGVQVYSGTVAISSCTISGNRAEGVHARVQKFLSCSKLPIALMGKNALLTCPIRFSSFMMGAASNYQSGVRAICARNFKSSHRPDGKLLTRLPRLTLAQLWLTLRSTTGGACRRDLKFSHRPDG